MTFRIIAKATSQPPRGATLNSQCIISNTNKTWGYFQGKTCIQNGTRLSLTSEIKDTLAEENKHNQALPNPATRGHKAVCQSQSLTCKKGTRDMGCMKTLCRKQLSKSTCEIQ